uniref:Right handed beta helix domain-containing protein n=1 Tax=Tetradesmus obliquus TaxID=3088 RepID=A0A383WCS1_TETOB|eukprot:jgi/Sobl393_1/6701/SZX74496.1
MLVVKLGAPAVDQRAAQADCRLLLLGYSSSSSSSSSSFVNSSSANLSRQGIARASLNCSSPAGPVAVAISGRYLAQHAQAFSGVNVHSSDACKAHSSAAYRNSSVEALLHFCSEQPLHLTLLQPVVHGVALAVDGNSTNSGIPALLAFGTINASIVGGSFINNTAGAAVIAIQQAALHLDSTEISYHVGQHARGVHAADSAAVSISNSSFSNMTAAGAVLASNKSRISITASTFINNTLNQYDSKGGGLLQFEDSATGTIIGSTISNTTAGQAGGLTAYGNAKAVITRSNFTGNTAASGGAVGVWASAQVTVDGCSFQHNTATTADGAVGVYDSSKVVITRSNFTGNKAGSGGAVGVWGSAQARISACVFDRNYAPGSGAGVWAQERAQVSISHTTFTGNTADKETAVAVTGDAQVNITSSLFDNNTAGQWGAAVVMGKRSKVTVNGCSFQHNAAKTTDGAVGVYDSSEAIITRSNFTDNRGTAGSAVGAWAKAQARISGCVFERNNASTSGAGVQAQEISQQEH